MKQPTALALEGAWSRFRQQALLLLRRLQELNVAACSRPLSLEEESEFVAELQRLKDKSRSLRLTEVARLCQRLLFEFSPLQANRAVTQLLVRLELELTQAAPTGLRRLFSTRGLVGIYATQQLWVDKLTVLAILRGFGVERLLNLEQLEEWQERPRAWLMLVEDPLEFELVSVVRARFPEVFLAVITSLTQVSQRQQALEAGADAVLGQHESPLLLFDPEGLGAWTARSRPEPLAHLWLLTHRRQLSLALVEGLEEAGYQVTLQELHPRSPWPNQGPQCDLVLLQQERDDQGLELLRVLRGHWQWSQVAILWLARSPERLEEGYAQGCDDAILLGAPLDQLCQRIDNRLQRRALSRNLGPGLPGIDERQEGQLKFAYLVHLAERYQASVTFALLWIPSQAKQLPKMIQLARRLSWELNRSTDLIVAWDSETLAVALYDTPREDGLQVLRRLMQAWSRPQEIHICAASYPADGAEAEDLMLDLETALGLCPSGVVSSLTEFNSPRHLLWVCDPWPGQQSCQEYFGYRSRRIQWVLESHSVQQVFPLKSELAPRVACVDLDIVFADPYSLIADLAAHSVRVIALAPNSVAPIYQAQEAGAFDILTKPVQVELLARRIERALGA